MTTISDAGTGDEVASVGPDPVAGTEQAPGGEVFDLAWSPDGDVLATAGLEDGRGVVSVVDRAGRSVSVLRDDPGVAILSLAFSPDGRSVATARVPMDRPDPDFTGVQIWDREDGDVAARIETGATTVEYDPEGTRLVTISDVSDGADVWDVERLERLATLEGHEGAVADAAFSPDGSSIATAGLDGTVRLWDAGSGTQLLVLRGHGTAVGHVAFSPDGSKVASVSGDGTARIWALDLDDLVAIAERELTRDLTDAECRQYLHRDSCG